MGPLLPLTAQTQSGLTMNVSSDGTPIASDPTKQAALILHLSSCVLLGTPIQNCSTVVPSSDNKYELLGSTEQGTAELSPGSSGHSHILLET